MTPWRPLPLPNLAPGRSGQGVLNALQTLTDEVRNVRSAGPDYQTALGRYIDWVSSAEVRLRTLFTGEDIAAALHTRRYWFLVEVGPGAEPWRFLHDEVEMQAAKLDHYQDQLRHEIWAFQLGEDELAVVLDTNFFLHYSPIHLVQWNKYLPAEGGHRLVVPAVVIKELDEKKFHPNRTLSKRARSVIRFLYQLRGDAHPEEPIALVEQPSVRVQVLLDPAGHRRMAAADDELLNRSEHLSALVNGRLTVGTADYGLHLEGAVRGLETWRPGTSLERARDPSDE